MTKNRKLKPYFTLGDNVCFVPNLKLCLASHIMYLTYGKIFKMNIFGHPAFVTVITILAFDVSLVQRIFNISSEIKYNIRK